MSKYKNGDRHKCGGTLLERIEIVGFYGNILWLECNKCGKRIRPKEEYGEYTTEHIRFKNLIEQYN